MRRNWYAAKLALHALLLGSESSKFRLIIWNIFFFHLNHDLIYFRRSKYDAIRLNFTIPPPHWAITLHLHLLLWLFATFLKSCGVVI